MGGYAETVPRGQRHLARKVGISERSFEDDPALVDNRDHAARLLGLTHLVLEPLFDVVEARLQPAVHVLHLSSRRSSHWERCGDQFTPAGAPLAAERARVAGAPRRRTG